MSHTKGKNKGGGGMKKYSTHWGESFKGFRVVVSTRRPWVEGFQTSNLGGTLLDEPVEGGIEKKFEARRESPA